MILAHATVGANYQSRTRTNLDRVSRLCHRIEIATMCNYLSIAWDNEPEPRPTLVHGRVGIHTSVRPPGTCSPRIPTALSEWVCSQNRPI